MIGQVHSWLVSKDRRSWNKTVYWFELIDIYMTLHPATVYTFFSSVMEHLPRLTVFWARNKFQQIGRVQVCSLACVRDPYHQPSGQWFTRNMRGIQKTQGFSWLQQREKVLRAESGIDQAQPFSGLRPVGSCGRCLILLGMMWDNTYGVLPIRDSLSNRGV